MSNAHLFVYGSLCSREVLAAVLGKPARSEAARLDDYAAMRLRGQSYPALLARAGRRTHGRLIRNLRAHELARLDRFEGRWYYRVPCRVATPRGAVRAFVYVLHPAARRQVQAQSWELETFLAQQANRFARYWRDRLRRRPRRAAGSDSGRR